MHNRINPTPENGCLITETDTMNAVAAKATKMSTQGTLNITRLKASSIDLGRSRRIRSPKIAKNVTEYSTIPIQHNLISKTIAP
jgi:hypothetical protein